MQINNESVDKLYFMNFLVRRSLIWVILNLVGMLTFLRLAAELWVMPGEEGLPGGPGDPFYWFFLLVPFQLIFLAVNFCALYVIVKNRSEPSIKRRVSLWIAVSILWIIVAAYDHHRSLREIAPLTASLRRSGRETSMDEYGQLIFLQGRADAWDKMESGFVLYEL